MSGFNQSQLKSLESTFNSKSTTYGSNPVYGSRASSAQTPLRRIGTGINSTSTTKILSVIANNQDLQTSNIVSAISKDTGITSSSLSDIPSIISNNMVAPISDLSRAITELKQNMTVQTFQDRELLSFLTLDRNKIKDTNLRLGRGSEFRFASRLAVNTKVSPTAAIAFSKPIHLVTKPGMTFEQSQISLLSALYTVSRFSGQELTSIRRGSSTNRFDNALVRRDSILEKITDKLNETPIIAPLIEIGRTMGDVVNFLANPISSTKSFFNKLFPSSLTSGADLAAKAGLELNTKNTAYQFLATQFPDISNQTKDILNRQLGVQENIQQVLEELLSVTTGRNVPKLINQRDVESKVFDPITATYISKVESDNLSKQRLSDVYAARRSERGMISRLFGFGKKADISASNSAIGDTFNDVQATSSQNIDNSKSELLANNSSTIQKVGAVTSVALAAVLGPIGLLGGLAGAIYGRRKLVKDGGGAFTSDNLTSADLESSSQPVSSNTAVVNPSSSNISVPLWQKVLVEELPKQTELLASSTLPFKTVQSPQIDPNSLQAIDDRLQAQKKSNKSLVIEKENRDSLNAIEAVLVDGEGGAFRKDVKDKKGFDIFGLLVGGLGFLTSTITSFTRTGLGMVGSALGGLIAGIGVLFSGALTTVLGLLGSAVSVGIGSMLALITAGLSKTKLGSTILKSIAGKGILGKTFSAFGKGLKSSKFGKAVVLGTGGVLAYNYVTSESDPSTQQDQTVHPSQTVQQGVPSTPQFDYTPSAGIGEKLAVTGAQIAGTVAAPLAIGAAAKYAKPVIGKVSNIASSVPRGKTPEVLKTASSSVKTAIKKSKNKTVQKGLSFALKATAKIAAKRAVLAAGMAALSGPLAVVTGPVLTAGLALWTAYDIFNVVKDNFFDGADPAAIKLKDESAVLHTNATAILKKNPTDPDGLSMEKKAKILNLKAQAIQFEVNGNPEAAKIIKLQIKKIQGIVSIEKPSTMASITNTVSSIYGTLKSAASTASSIVSKGIDIVKPYVSSAASSVSSTASSISSNINRNIPLGIRNNNPGNLRANINWNGMVGKDSKGFAIFDTAANGIRAASKNIDTYVSKYNLTSVDDIISRWAPSSENDTSSYVRAVSKALGVGPNTSFDVQAKKPELLKAIFIHENGGIPYSDSLIRTASNTARNVASNVSNVAGAVSNSVNNAYQNTRSNVSNVAGAVSNSVNNAYQNTRSAVSNTISTKANTVSPSISYNNSKPIVSSIPPSNSTTTNNTDYTANINNVSNVLSAKLNSVIEAVNTQSEVLVKIISQSSSNATPISIPPGVNTTNSMQSTLDKLFASIPSSVAYGSVKFAGLNQGASSYA